MCRGRIGSLVRECRFECGQPVEHVAVADWVSCDRGTIAGFLFVASTNGMYSHGMGVPARVWICRMVTCLLALGAGGLVFAASRADRTATFTGEWDTYISLVGGPGAYAELARRVDGYDPNEAHRVAHAFGDALYRTRGIAGMHVCDDRYLYGCMHAFVARAIEDAGLEVVEMLFALCDRKPMCTHAIGHGLVAHLGYEPENIRDAVSLCEDLPADDFFNGCGSGVFMEHFLRGMAGRPEDSWDPGGDVASLVSCDAFSDAALGTCHFWHVQYLWEEGNRDRRTYDDIFESISRFCATLIGDAHLSCVSGAGQAAVSMSEYRPENVSRRCTAFFSDAADVFHCLVFGGRALAGSVSDDAGRSVCAAVPHPYDRDTCVKTLESPLSPNEF